MLTHIGPYEIVRELGRGGMGVVYRGRDPMLDRPVAIKLVSESILGERTAVERFLREARTMARIADPNVVQIYFIGELSGRPYLVMEFIEGEDLSDVLKREGRLSPKEALRLVALAARGLHAAHKAGVIHRDIKPANLIRTREGGIKITDFGIALAQDGASKLTGTGAIVGTPGYLSPEACLGNTLDARSDIYSLGVVLYELLVGRLPYRNSSPLSMMMEIVQAEVPDLMAVDRSFDPALASLLRTMLAKDPKERHPDCATLVAAIEALSGAGLKTPLPPPAPGLGPVQLPGATPMPPAAPVQLGTGPGAAGPPQSLPPGYGHSGPIYPEPLRAPGASTPPIPPGGSGMARPPATPPPVFRTPTPPPSAAAPLFRPTGAQTPAVAVPQAYPGGAGPIVALGWVMLVALVLTILMQLWGTLSLADLLYRISQIQSEYSGTALGELPATLMEARDEQRTAVMGLGMLLGLPSMVLFLVWQFVAHKNALVMRGEAPGNTPLLGALGWFIPLANLYFSGRSMHDIHGSSGGGAIPVVIWWGCIWSSLALGFLALGGIDELAQHTLEDYALALMMDICSRLLWVVAGVCLGWIALIAGPTQSRALG
ncbi:MAG: protein kinase [Xanthomonadales bacterium]|jgi:serine/threonine protein kinase|nr:protein kinase [Xanthomonadales bacterium]